MVLSDDDARRVFDMLGTFPTVVDRLGTLERFTCRQHAEDISLLQMQMQEAQRMLGERTRINSRRFDACLYFVVSSTSHPYPNATYAGRKDTKWFSQI